MSRFLGAWLIIAAAVVNIYTAKDSLVPVAWFSSVLISVVAALLATKEDDKDGSV